MSLSAVGLITEVFIDVAIDIIYVYDKPISLIISGRMNKLHIYYTITLNKLSRLKSSIKCVIVGQLYHRLWLFNSLKTFSLAKKNHLGIKKKPHHGFMGIHNLSSVPSEPQTTTIFFLTLSDWIRLHS